LNTVQIHIRSAIAADIPAMMRLGSHVATAAHWSRQQYEGLFESGAAFHLVLVIEAQQTLQGFLIAREVAAEWEIENIAIAGPARRRGLGTRLLRYFLDYAQKQGASAVFLEVRESNTAARSLYEKWAFQESGRRPRYYTQPQEDAILYKLILA
jgi:ribosomal-protein-alanine N-acetyltransferase